MWEPQRLTTLWASTACYRDSFTFLSFCVGSSVSLKNIFFIPSLYSPVRKKPEVGEVLIRSSFPCYHHYRHSVEVFFRTITPPLDLVLQPISCKNKPSVLGTLIMTVNGAERDFENKHVGRICRWERAEFR
jgi:hypothetical protein